MKLCFLRIFSTFCILSIVSVSYTHLDVYKRQPPAYRSSRRISSVHYLMKYPIHLTPPYIIYDTVYHVIRLDVPIYAQTLAMCVYGGAVREHVGATIINKKKEKLINVTSETWPRNLIHVHASTQLINRI